MAGGRELAAQMRRRFGYLGSTLEARHRARPGPPPADDAAWAALLRRWLDLQANIFCDQVDADLAGRPAPCPDLVGRARRLWSLAHLQRHGIGREAVASAVPRAWRAMDRHADREHGGWVWAVDPSGAVTDGRKALYAQSMAVHALAEVARLEDASGPRALAEATAALTLATGPRTPWGAVIELRDRDWSPLPVGIEHAYGRTGTISIGGALHLFEAAALLVVAGGDRSALSVAEQTAALLHDRFLGPRVAVLAEDTGTPRPDPVSLGHEVEAAWLLADHAEALGLVGERERCRRIVDAALAVGFRHGAQGDSPETGFRLGGHQRAWWIQAELVRALVEFDDGPGGVRRGTLHTLLRWLHRRQVDPRTGQSWQLMTHWAAVLVTGQDTSARTGYHDVRAYVAAADLLAPAPPGNERGIGGRR